MDETTRQAALVKAKAITDMIGFPDYILEAEALNKKYARLEVAENEYFENAVRFHNFSFVENLEKLDQVVNRSRWSMTPPTVNAYYTPTKNQIVFPAGLLQVSEASSAGSKFLLPLPSSPSQIPFFSANFPNSLNFGAMGVVMGHELSHAFDDQGREYDADGNMRDWWNNRTLLEFKNRTACMEQQYSAYDVGGRENVSGAQTLGENIADNGGLTAAFYAYQDWLRKKGIEAEQPLPGVELTHNQLFFLSFSQVITHVWQVSSPADC
jgi:endothelin-converting enzyme